MDELHQVIGRRMREEREQRGLKLEDVAGQAELDVSALSRIERGQRKVDSLVLRRVARLFDLPMDAFFSDRSIEPLVLARSSGDDSVLGEAQAWGLRLMKEARFLREEQALAR